MELDAAAFETKDENVQKLLRGVEDLHTYVERNQGFVPNYGERYRNGEKIASGFVESAINQPLSFRKKCGLERGKGLGGGLPTG